MIVYNRQHCSKAKYTYEANMLHLSNSHSRCLRFNRSVILICISLVLQLIASTDSSARALQPAVGDIFSQESARDGYAAVEEDSTDIAAALNKESLPTNAAAGDSASTTADKGMTSTDAAGTEPKISGTDTAEPDWNGVIRDTSIIFGGQVAAVGITYLLPESFSSWSPEQKKAGAEKYGRNFVNPAWDKDKFYVNYVLHPYWGATYYTRGRERGLDQAYSFAFSALLSALYEFGTECIAERPSIQDLIVTPIAGSLLGAYVFEPWRNAVKSKPELRWYDHTVLILTDPLGVISLGIEKLFGVKSTIMVNVPIPQAQSNATTTANNYFGATMQFPLN